MSSVDRRPPTLHLRTDMLSLGFSSELPFSGSTCNHGVSWEAAICGDDSSRADELHAFVQGGRTRPTRSLSRHRSGLTAGFIVTSDRLIPSALLRAAGAPLEGLRGCLKSFPSS